MDETVEPVKKRRRSSILNRHAQDSDPPVHAEGSENEEYIFKIACPDNVPAEDETLKGYINDLESEKACWKSLLKERKALKESANSSTTPELLWSTAHNFLTEEDVAFLKAEPPFEKIAEDFDRLVKDAAVFGTKSEQVSQLASRATGLAQLRLDKIKQNIAEYSYQTVEVPLTQS